MKIFIDTNIFLGFYEENFDHIQKMFDLSDIKKFLVTIDYCWDEYLRNRSSVFNFLLAEIEAHQPKDPHRTSFISEFDEFKKAKKHSEEAKKAIKELKIKIEKGKNDTNEDIIFTKLFAIYQDSHITKLKINSTLIERAKKRKLLGNPPLTKDTHTIGDELIWETLLDNIRNEDLIIVSRDKTFNTHSDFLKKEFRDTVGKDLLVFDKLKDAFKNVGVSAPPDLSIFETKDEKTTLFPPSTSFVVAATGSNYAIPNFSPTDTIFCPRCFAINNRSASRCVNCGSFFGCD